MKWLIATVLLLSCTAASAETATFVSAAQKRAPTPTDFASTAARIKAAIANPRRTAAETSRDANRKPLRTLEFFGLRDNMTVLELVPGEGWYTHLLGPTLEANGKLYISINAEKVYDGIKGKPGFASTHLVPFDPNNFTRIPGEMRTTVPEFSFDLKQTVDLVLTFRNLHDFTEEGRLNIDSAIFEALKPGGYYGVVDHTRRHMQPDSYEVWRRMDPVEMIKEIQSVGFRFVDYSTLHYHPDDELRYEVGRKSVTGNTDRFTLLFRKPEKNNQD